METIFRLYNGLAGDPHQLLTAVSQLGIESSALVDTTGFFKHWRLRSEKKKLLRDLEIRTGNRHFEI